MKIVRKCPKCGQEITLHTDNGFINCTLRCEECSCSIGISRYAKKAYLIYDPQKHTAC